MTMLEKSEVIEVLLQMIRDINNGDLLVEEMEWFAETAGITDTDPVEYIYTGRGHTKFSWKREVGDGSVS